MHNKKQELDKLCTTQLSESALRRALQQLRGQLAISAQNQENTALAMAKSMLYFGYAPDWNETFRKIERTTAEQLQKISKETLNSDDIYTLIYE